MLTKKIASIWRGNILRYLSADIICSKNRTVFWGCRSRKTVMFEQQIMFQEQISEHIFKVKWRLLCLLSFKYFRNTWALPVCHMSITSKLVNWHQKSPRLSVHFETFSWRNMSLEKVQHFSERKRDTSCGYGYSLTFCRGATIKLNGWFVNSTQTFLKHSRSSLFNSHNTARAKILISSLQAQVAHSYLKLFTM